MSSFNKRKAVKEKSLRSKQQVVELEELLLDPHKTQRATPASDQMLLVLPPSSFYVDDQVRQQIDPHEIEQRAASMRTNGQIQAIVVYPADTKGENKGRYKIDKGECRWRAAQLIEGFQLKAIIDFEAPKRDNRKRIVGQIVENDQRADLKPIELADALQALLNEGMTQEEVAQELGWITRSKKPNINKVSRILSILKLPEIAKQLIRDGIVLDLITLEFLRKVFEINPNKCSLLCDLAREDNGLSRKRAELVFKQCKSNEKVVTQIHKGDRSGQSDSFSHERNRAMADGDRSSELQKGHPSYSAPEASQQENLKGLPGHSVGEKAPLAAPELLPVIHVEWRGLKEGVLAYDRAPEGEGEMWIQLKESGDFISVELDDLKIKAVTQ